MLTKRESVGLWTLTVLDILLFFPAAYMGLSSIAILSGGISSPFVLTYAVLLLLLPIVCVLGPVLAWRSARVGETDRAFTFAVLPFAGLVLIILVVAGGHLLTPLP